MVEEYLAAGAGRSASMANELADSVVVDEWLTCPIDADWTEEAMFDRIPFGCASRIMGHGDAQTSLVCDQLESSLPGVRAGAIGAARVGKDQQMAGVGMGSAPG